MVCSRTPSPFTITGMRSNAISCNETCNNISPSISHGPGGRQTLIGNIGNHHLYPLGGCLSRFVIKLQHCYLAYTLTMIASKKAMIQSDLRQITSFPCYLYMCHRWCKRYALSVGNLGQESADWCDTTQRRRRTRPTNLCALPRLISQVPSVFPN
jgi:hypothetical protein